MDKNLMGLIGAVTALAAAGQAHAATAAPVSVDEAMQASSFADLLKPIPDAVRLLQASDAVEAGRIASEARTDGQPMVYEVQYYAHHHHHHHHHRYYRRVHHHHHHHHALLRVGPVVVR